VQGASPREKKCLNQKGRWGGEGGVAAVETEGAIEVKEEEAGMASSSVNLGAARLRVSVGGGRDSPDADE
jgi:hypothetical protein